MRDLRMALTQQEFEEIYHMFIQKGGIQMLVNYLEDESVGQYIKEEVIWSLTNLSVMSSVYE